MTRFLQFEGLCIGLTLCIVALVYSTGSEWLAFAAIPAGGLVGWWMARLD